MNFVRKYLGILWILLAAATLYFGVSEFGIPKITSDKQEDIVFGIIILFILLPLIVGGLVVFGKYCWDGEYNEENF